MSYWWYLSFTVEEIKESVWQCERSESSGLDGFNFYFIKQFWDILKRMWWLLFKNSTTMVNW